MTRPRVGALIPIRLASERLPGKALKEICGKPALCHLLDRVFASWYVDREDVVVCTTQEPGDDPLVEVVEGYGARVFRGSTNDIIRRFRDAITEFGFDMVLQVDGDDVLCEPLYMGLTLERLMADETVDIVTCEGLPLGIAAKSFTAKAMERVFEHYETQDNDTGFIYFFTKTDLCKHAVVRPLTPRHVLDGARLTLDYEEDLEVLRRIFEALWREGELFHLEDVVAFLKQNPEVVAINRGVEEDYWRRTRAKARLEYRTAEGRLERISL